MAWQNDEIRTAVRYSGEPTLDKAALKAQEQYDQIFNVCLNIAVSGETGAGKSTFINAIRDLDDSNEGAAQTGVIETTKEPTPYEHPTIPNVVLWDLPGIGSPNFKAKTYLKQVEFEKYDFFIIVSSERFRENDIKLAKMMQKKQKKFYFVRSKIDNDIREESKKAGFNKQEILDKIRGYCEANLEGIKDPRVFLISSKCLYDYDFDKLVATLLSELPELKHQVLLQSVPVSSLAMLEEKVKMFEKAIWAIAFVSAGIAAVPVPGLSVACDAAVLVGFFTRCYFSFGLNKKSIDKLSMRLNKPHLKSLIQSHLVLELVSNSAAELSATAGTAAVRIICKLVPGVGSIAAAGISFVLILTVLKNGLKEIADTARTVLREAGLQ